MLRSLNRNLNQSPTRSSKKGLLKRLAVLLVIIALIYFPTRGAYLAAKKLVASGKGIQASLKANNLDDVKKYLVQSRKAGLDLNNSLNFLFWARIIPFFGGFYLDAKHFTTAANYELQAAEIIINDIYPKRVELGFTGQPVPGQDQIAQLVKILDQAIPSLDKVEPQLKKASKEVASIDVNKYPEFLGGKRLRSQIQTAKNFIGGAHYVVTEGKEAIKAAPKALGQPDPKTYLLLFQNDKEIRATGGFLTAYAFMKLDKGHVKASNSDDIYRLDEKLLKVCVNKVCPLRPPAPIVKYLPEVDGRVRTVWAMRDSNISPDLPLSLIEFERMYSLLGEGEKFDGIITIDTRVVEELIKITGPIEVLGTKYSGDKDDRCNCVNVIYELERYAQVIEKGEADRKAVLGVLMQQLLARSLGASAEKAPEFINALITLANEKHIMFYMHDNNLQTALSKFNWTGKITQTSGDYLHINDSNFAGGKSNLYVEQKVNLEIDPSNGKHRLTIDYKNPQPFNTWLNGINRDYVRIYLPKGAKLVSSKGSDDPVKTQEDEELNKTYFEAFITVRPQNSRSLSFEYTTPRIETKDNHFPLLVQRQPGAKEHHVTVKIKGNKKAEFDLKMDQDLSLPL